jgi:muramidase (phage lysozyme)
MARISAQAAGGVAVLAFLDMVAWSEIGPKLLAVTDDGYNVEEGSTAAVPLLFADYSHHPRHMDVIRDSTAAGRYEIIWPTWRGLVADFHFPDFSPVSQDAAAIELIRQRRALDFIRSGRISDAIQACNQEWASFSGAHATLPDGTPQHEQKLTDLLQAYHAALVKYQSTPPCTPSTGASP